MIENPRFRPILDESGRNLAPVATQRLSPVLLILIRSPASAGDDERVGYLVGSRDDPDRKNVGDSLVRPFCVTGNFVKLTHFREGEDGGETGGEEGGQTT